MWIDELSCGDRVRIKGETGIDDPIWGVREIRFRTQELILSNEYRRIVAHIDDVAPVFLTRSLLQDRVYKLYDELGIERPVVEQCTEDNEWVGTYQYPLPAKFGCSIRFLGPSDSLYLVIDQQGSVWLCELRNSGRTQVMTSQGSEMTRLMKISTEHKLNSLLRLLYR